MGQNKICITTTTIHGFRVRVEPLLDTDGEDLLESSPE